MSDGSRGRHLTGENWARADALFHEALGHPAPERERFVREARGVDTAVRDEVLELLHWDTQSNPARVTHAIRLSLEETDMPAGGMQLGPWHVEHEIGRGGMSVVYLGRRVDGAYQKQVAIKLIKRGMDTQSVILRLRRERSILASLDHPYIARLLDGGATPDGRPYIVMEYVEGLPIDRYCEQNRLSIRERCELMVKVCGAVSYAHRNMVVHRDLKPANILITNDGTPKLLDFGIAKLLTAESEEGPLTRGPVGPLTPEYASPEQSAGRRLGSGTDVYSLGLICFEMLTGARPAEHGEKASEAALRNGRGSKWAQQLRGDLEIILQMALREEPERRYLSVAAFQSDLNAWLSGLPVSAREDTLLYLATKFISRHRVAAAAVMIGALSLIAGTAIALDKAHEAERARAIAEDRLGQIVGLSNQSLVDVSKQLEQMPGTMEARRELVSSIITMLERQQRDAGSNEGLRRALARAYLRLSSLQGGPDGVNLRDFKGAEESISTGLRLIGDSPGATAEQTLLWLDLRTRRGVMVSLLDRRPEALAGLEETLKTLDALPAERRSPPEMGRLREQLFLFLARAAHDNLPLARKYAEESLRLTERLLAEDQKNADVKMDLSVAHTELGYVLWSLGEGDPEKAIDHYLESLRLREELARDYPANLQFQRNLMLQYQHVASLEGGVLAKSMGRTEVARTYFLKSKAIGEQLVADPRNTSVQEEFGEVLIHLGSLDVAPSGLEASLADLRRGLDLCSRAIYRNPPIGMLGHMHAAEKLAALGRSREASSEYESSLRVAKEILAKSPANRLALQTQAQVTAEMARVR